MAKQVYQTAKGTLLFWEVVYNLGGPNYLGSTIPRGYSIFITRKPHSFVVMHGLQEPDGAGRQTLLEVSRRSKKQEALAIEKANAILPVIANRFNL